MSSRRERFLVNGRWVSLELAPGETLLATLRRGGYTEVKCGCEEGKCGACLVLLDGRSVNACQVLSMSVRERPITTAAGLGTLFEPSALQRAFAETGAVQCGFCTPGFIVAAASAFFGGAPASPVSASGPTDPAAGRRAAGPGAGPTEEEIRRALDGNLCRCTGYGKIVEAVRLAVRRAAGG